VQLFKEVYRAGLVAGATQCLLSTRKPLISIFSRFGFKACDYTFVDQVAGEMIVCRLDLHDLEHLAMVSSPLIDIVCEQFQTMSDAHQVSDSQRAITKQAAE
jgi:hypothetical protein